MLVKPAEQGITAEGLIHRAKGVYGDYGDHFGAPFLLELLNDCLRELGTSGLGIEDSRTLAIVANTAEYDFPDRCLRVRQITWSGEPLASCKSHEVRSAYGSDWTTRTGTHPELWFPRDDNKYRFVPIPTAANATDGVLWGLFKHPELVSPTDAIRFPDHRIPVLRNYLCYMMAVSDADVPFGGGRILLFRQMWEAGRAEWQHDLDEADDEPRYVRAIDIEGMGAGVSELVDP